MVLAYAQYSVKPATVFKSFSTKCRKYPRSKKKAIYSAKLWFSSEQIWSPRLLDKVVGFLVSVLILDYFQFIITW